VLHYETYTLNEGMVGKSGLQTYEKGVFRNVHVICSDRRHIAGI